MTGDWDAALDALEEWLRRTRDELAEGRPAPDVVPVPRTPVPEDLRLRATALLQRMSELEGEALRQRAALQRARTYQH